MPNTDSSGTDSTEVPTVPNNGETTTASNGAEKEPELELEAYVSKDLFAHYSGRFNAAEKLFNAQSTTWFDLSGNGNTVMNVPLDSGKWRGSSYVIEDDALLLPTAMTELVNSDCFTVELAIGSFDVGSTVKSPNPAFLWSMNDQFSLFYSKSKNQIQFYRGSSYDRLTYDCTDTYNLTLTLTFELGGSSILYVNGKEASRLPADAPLNADTLKLNDNSGKESRLALSEYYDIRFYERALSADEVAQNYGTDQRNYFDHSNLNDRLYSKNVLRITPELLKKGEEMPQINHSPLPKYSYDNLDYAMTIGIERTREGRLFSCWVGGGDSDKAFFVLAMSDNDGKDWSDPILVIDPHSTDLPCARSALVGNLWLDPLGRLWLFFNQSLGQFDGKSSNWYIRCDNPDADTLVWSDPVYVSYGMSLNKPIVLSDGTYLMNVSLWQRKNISGGFTDCYRELDNERGAWVYASVDQGKTWKARGIVKFPDTSFDEHMVIENKDGTLTMYGRTNNGIFVAHSSDKGATWSEPVVSNIAHLASRFCIRRLSSGKLILIKHGRTIDTLTTSRYDLTVFLSDDDGKTWYGGLTIDTRNKISYPDMTEGENGEIYIQYDYERAARGHILYAKITEADIIAKKLVTPTSSLQNFVSIAFGLASNQGLKP